MSYTQPEETLKFRRMHSRQGFTLLELLTTISIMTILAVAATPILQTLPASARLKERSDRLSAQLQTARSEAIRSNKIVYICALRAKTNLQVQGCNRITAAKGYSWNQGSLVYADAAGAGKTYAGYDSGEHISHVVFNDKVGITANIAQIAFLPSGRTRGAQSVDFVIRDNQTNGCRTVRMDSSGRPRVCRTGEACNVC